MNNAQRARRLAALNDAALAIAGDLDLDRVLEKILKTAARLVAILCGIHTAGNAKVIYVNPDLPDWLPDLTLKNLRAGKGSAQLRMKRDEVEVLSNTTGFEIVHGRLPRPPLTETPLART